MAPTINFYNTWQRLQTADTSDIEIGDEVTGQTSGAVGVVVYLSNNAHYEVLVKAGVFVNETIENMDGDTKAIITAAASPALANYVEVYGDHTAIPSLDIYEDIRTASVGGGWGIHSALDSYTTQLDCHIEFGTWSQGENTDVTTQNERVRVNGKHFIRPVYGGAFTTTFNVGDGTRDGTDLTWKVSDGSTIIYNDLFLAGHPSLHDADALFTNIFGSKLINLSSKNTQFHCVFRGFRFNISGGYAIFFGYSDQIIADFIAEDSPGAGLVSTAAGQTWNDVYSRDNNYGIFVLGVAEGTFTDTTLLDNTNDFGGFFTTFTVNMIDSICDPYDIVSFWGQITVKEFFTSKLSAITENGAALPGVDIRIWNNQEDRFADPPGIDETTDGSGEIPDQQLQTVETFRSSFGAGPPDTVIEYTPHKFLITREGWKRKRFNDTINGVKEYAFTMENVEDDFE